MKNQAVATTLAILAIIPAEGAQALPILVSPLSFDFGDVFIGETSPQQSVDLLNVSENPQAISLAGGAAGVFGGVTNCSVSLSAGEACQVFYDFSPVELGPAERTTSLSVNGEISTFSFRGNGVVPLRVSPTSLDFGDVPVGTTAEPQSVTITNLSDAPQDVSLAGGAAGVFGGFTSCGGSLAPGASCEVSYAFAPTDGGTADRTTSLSVNGDLVGISLAGEGDGDGASPFLVTPLEFDFGSVEAGETSASQSVTITNVSDSLQAPSLAGGAAGVFGGVTSCGATLAPGESCEVTYAFSPSEVGATERTTSLSINGEIVEFDFRGEGLDPLLVSPLAFDFGEIEVGGASASQAVRILNVSDVPQDLSLAGGAAGVFGGVTTCGGTLAPDAWCEIIYTFEPTEAGAADRTSSLSVNGDLATFSFAGVGLGDDGGAPNAPVPLPAPLALLGAALVGLALMRRRPSGA